MPDARRRWKVLALLAALALLMHAGLLGGLRWAWPTREAAPVPALAIQVRNLSAETPAPLLAPSASKREVPAPKPAARALARAAKPPAPEPPAAAKTGPAPGPVVLADAPTPAERAAVPGSVDSLVPITPPSSPADNEVPIYRTRIPPAVTLHYDLRRGALQGSGELQWRPQGEHYHARLDGRLGDVNVLTQTSEGGFDAAGLAPERFTDQRLRREVRAANFQREAGKITFSGPSTEFPLVVGAQDRLSWMVQLAAIVAAEPQRIGPGGKVAIVVVGARGDMGIWVFRYVDREWLSTGESLIHAAKFMREPRDAYDTGVEVWLDPERHHLPARALLRAGTDGEALEMLLRQVELAP
jgi:hypothetical protein